ncbi:MAG: hypothetical protein Q4A16_04845 [Lautropia sp.]|nr:hypothetical protein [Lautropia sp.]
MPASSHTPAKPLSSSTAVDAQALPYAVLEHLGVLRIQGKDAASFLQNQLTQDVSSMQNGQLRLAGYCNAKGRLLATFWVIRQDQVQGQGQGQVQEPATDQAAVSPPSAASAERLRYTVDGNDATVGTGNDTEIGSDEPESGPPLPTFWLLCARDITASIGKRLAMYVLRAKVEIEDVSTRYLLLGFVGTLTEALRPLPVSANEVIAVPMPDVRLAETTAALLTTPARRYLGADHRLSRCLLIVSPDALAERSADDGMLHYRYSPTDWQQLEVASGVPWITAATQELFVPQMVNLELVDGVSFSKGCYPGQEIVARSKYLGKQKRRMYAGLCSGQLPLPGTDVLAYDGTPIGLIVQAASLSINGKHEPMQRVDEEQQDQESGSPAVESLAASCKRYLLLFEARIDAIGTPLQGPGMIATSLLIGDAAIGMLQLPYACSD